jgi:hypothetical protein
MLALVGDVLRVVPPELDHPYASYAYRLDLSKPA